MAGGLTLMGGIVMLVAAAPAVGVAVVLLSALYFALAEIINYLAIIAQKLEGDHRFLADEGSEAPVECEVRSRYDAD